MVGGNTANSALTQALPAHLLVETTDEKEPRPKCTTGAGRELAQCQGPGWKGTEYGRHLWASAGTCAEGGAAPPCPFTLKPSCRAPCRPTVYQSPSPDDKRGSERACALHKITQCASIVTRFSLVASCLSPSCNDNAGGQESHHCPLRHHSEAQRGESCGPVPELWGLSSAVAQLKTSQGACSVR